MRGYVGMKVGVDSSSPTSQSAETQPANAFIEAFRGLLKLFALINLNSRWYLGDNWNSDDIRHMYECIAGY